MEDNDEFNVNITIPSADWEGLEATPPASPVASESCSIRRGAATSSVAVPSPEKRNDSKIESESAPPELPADNRVTVLGGDVSVEGMAKKLKDGEFKNIVVMTGAGLSVAAGIPDFRSSGSGLYSNLGVDLPDDMSPEDVFNIHVFQKTPSIFTTVAKRIAPGSFQPTLAHYLPVLLHQKGLLLRHYTQNIDTLERVAGVPEEKLVEAHGSFSAVHCVECGEDYGVENYKKQLEEFNPKTGDVPRCKRPLKDSPVKESAKQTDEADIEALTAEVASLSLKEKKDRGMCNGLVKPDIVFFGETLPQRFSRAMSDLARADLLIVMGTSLKVMPFCSLVSMVKPYCPRLLINNEPVMYIESDKELPKNPFVGGAFRFNLSDNYRDVFLKGTCDYGAQKLCDLAGWGEELRRISKERSTRAAESESKGKECCDAPT